MSEECPCIRDYSNITIENQKENDEFGKDSPSLLPEKLLLANTELMKIRGLKMSALGKRWQNNALYKYETEEEIEFASSYCSAVAKLFAYKKHSDNPIRNRDAKKENFSSTINNLFKSAQKAGNITTDDKTAKNTGYNKKSTQGYQNKNY